MYATLFAVHPELTIRKGTNSVYPISLECDSVLHLREVERSRDHKVAGLFSVKANTADRVHTCINLGSSNILTLSQPSPAFYVSAVQGF